MSNSWELMLMYSDQELEIEDALKIEQIIRENKYLKKGYLLNRQINEFMRAELMLEEAKADTELDEIESSIKSNIAKFQNKPKNSDIGLTFYINGALSESKIIENQIDESEREMYLKGIYEETNQWVQMWKEEVDLNGVKDNYTLEIANYVKRGMENTKSSAIFGASKNKIRKLVIRISSAAAVFIIALGIWGLFGSKPTTDDLFTEYYKPYNVIDGQTRSYNQTDEEFIAIARLYKNGKYNSVALKLDDWIKNEINSPKILLIYGITQIEQHDYIKAINCFNGIIKDEGEFSIEAKWYLALCYIKIKEIKKAKALLLELSKTPGIYKSKAKELLNDF